MTSCINFSCLIIALLFIFGVCPGTGEICTKSICEYEFDIRETRSMMYRLDVDHAYQVRVDDDGVLKLQETSFHRTVPNITVPLDNVHTADGYNKTIITINDQFPGPTIEVLEGAEPTSGCTTCPIGSKSVYVGSHALFTCV
ncbi:uncharacterized protein LOC110242402 [Exaiptasia diaphana]|uniref:Uncharacterized protein n=1 Tax=Exaiptasia diaphana TaxID=2652724 RepID=A0A913YL73_EXADI|nr:uncharacterized protein LOC110242402 [Exaiptasia diaphana]